MDIYILYPIQKKILVAVTKCLLAVVGNRFFFVDGDCDELFSSTIFGTSVLIELFYLSLLSSSFISFPSNSIVHASADPLPTYVALWFASIGCGCEFHSFFLA